MSTQADDRTGGTSRASRVPEGMQLSLQQLIDNLLRRWPLLAAITIGVAACTFAASFFITPAYLAEARLSISPQQRPVVGAASESGGPDQAVVDTEAQIMRSRDLAQRVAMRLDLAQDSEFNPDRLPAARNADGTAAAPEKVVDALIEHVEIARDANSYLVTIAARSTDPQKAARIANAFAGEYLRSSVERTTGTAAQEAAWLDERLTALGAEVQAADARVAEYRANAGIVEGGAQGTITDQQVAPLSTQLATAEAQAAAARANVTAARAQIARGDINAVSNVLNSTTIGDLRRQRAEVAREQAQIAERYGPRHDETLRVTRQIDDLDRALLEEAQRITNALESSARASEASAASLRGELARLRAQQAGNTRAAVMAESLERQAEARRTVYNQLAQAAQQSNQAQRSSVPQASIVQQAAPPTQPDWPNRKLFAALGLALGLFAGVATVVLLDAFSTGIRTVDDVERGLGLPFIVSLPRLEERQLRGAGGQMTPAQYVVARPMSAYAEALRAIRGSLHLRPTGGNLRTVAITSAVPREGKTSTAYALARIMALSGDRVILLDCDVRRGGFGLETPNAGLMEVLEGRATLEEAIVKDEVEGLDLLPIRVHSQSPEDVFGGDRMRAILAALRDRYLQVVLDTPPVLAVADARTVANLADATLFVVRAQSTPMRAARAALDLLAQDGTFVEGAVLSMVSPKSRHLGRANPAYYSRLYKSYYS